MEYPRGVMSRKQLGTTVLAGLLGYLANGHTIEVWNGLEIAFGSPFTYAIAALFGPWWGAVAASLAGGRTLVEWGHPYAALLHLTEVIAVGYLVRAGVPVVPSAVAFWMSLGLPLAVVLYGIHLGLSWPFVTMVGLADFFSGLIGALLTHFLVWSQRDRQFFRKFGAYRIATHSLRNDIFTGMILAGTVPLFALLLYSGTALREREEASARSLLARSAEIVARCLDSAQTSAIRASVALPHDQRRPGFGPDSVYLWDIGVGTRLLWPSTDRGTLPPPGPREFDVALAAQGPSGVSGQQIGPGGVLRVDPAERCQVAVRHSDAFGVTILQSPTGRELVSYTVAGDTAPEFGHLEASDLLASIAGSAFGSGTFSPNASDPDPFKRKAYLVGHALAASGLRVIFYQPAASATRGAAHFQMWASFWVVVAALASAIFASWFGRRVVSPVRDLRDYLEGLSVNSDGGRPLPTSTDAPSEILPLWSGVQNLQQRTVLAVTQAQEAAEVALGATRQKSEFLATISHEIRTPLNCILGMLPRVRAEALSPGQSDALALIDRSGQHLLSILNDVLEFSRIEQGRLQLRSDPFETITICEEAFELLVPAATQKGLDLTWVFSPDTPAFCKGDALRIKQILLNLAGNAVKFTESGSIEIDLGWQPQPASKTNGFIACRVRDTGPGIDPDRLGNLFQPFWQLSEPVGTPENIGAGLGLSIVKRLLDRMGGSIQLESTLGAGTTVSVSVPVEVVQREPESAGKRSVIAGPVGRVQDSLAAQLYFLGCTPEVYGGIPVGAGGGRWLFVDEELAAEREQVASGYLGSLLDSGWRVCVYQRRCSRLAQLDFTNQPPGVRYLPSPPSVRKLRAACASASNSSVQSSESPEKSASIENPLRILVAEDNSENRLVIELLLRRLGYRPVIVNDGIAAWEAIQSREFDLAILDLRMPGLDGLSLARRIQENLSDPPRLVALTASVFDTDRKRSFEAGFSEFLSKPIQESALLSVLSAVPPVARPASDKVSTWCTKSLSSFLQVCGTRADDMIQTFFEDVSVWLQSPIGNFPPDRIADQAHKLAGSALLIGAVKLAEALKAIEAAAPDGQSELAPAIGYAAECYETTSAELSAIRSFLLFPSSGRTS